MKRHAFSYCYMYCQSADGEEFHHCPVAGGENEYVVSYTFTLRLSLMNFQDFPKRNVNQEHADIPVNYNAISSVAQASLLFAATLYLLHAAGVY